MLKNPFFLIIYHNIKNGFGNKKRLKYRFAELKAKSQKQKANAYPRLKPFVAYVAFVPFHIIHRPSAISVSHEGDKKRPRLTVGGGEREVGRRMPAGAKIGIFRYVF